MSHTNIDAKLLNKILANNTMPMCSKERKFFSVNLTRHVLDLYTQNPKTLVGEPREF